MLLFREYCDFEIFGKEKGYLEA